MIGDIANGLNDLKEGLVDEAKARLDDIDAALPRVAVEDPTYSQLAEFASAMYHAEVLLAEGSVEECIAVCRTISLPSMPAMSGASLLFYNYPADRDVLARAYIKQGAMDDAIAEYEHLVIFDPNSKDRRLIYPLFHYRLALLCEEKGMPGKAARQYEKFLEICGDADPELTEVPDARRRLAALAGE